MTHERDHICVCICTYKRPEMLLRLLSELEKQRTDGLFEFSVLIVDNDKSESARGIVETYASRSNIETRYFIEAEQNISLARNKALENATGNFIGMIDDDEYPAKNWLLSLYNAYNKYNPTGGVLGPVIPYYPEGTPKWLIRSKICDRPNHPSGTELDWNMTRGGNVLLLRKIFQERSFIFDPNLGRNGGEDKELFKRIMEHGYTFVWSRNAEAYEIVYQTRWELSHYLKRALLNGGDAGKEHGKLSLFFITKSIISFICYFSLLILTIFMGRHYTYKYFIRVVYDFARLFGCFNISFITVRYD